MNVFLPMFQFYCKTNTLGHIWKLARENCQGEDFDRMLVLVLRLQGRMSHLRRCFNIPHIFNNLCANTSKSPSDRTIDTPPELLVNIACTPNQKENLNHHLMPNAYGHKLTMHAHCAHIDLNVQSHLDFRQWRAHCVYLSVRIAARAPKTYILRQSAFKLHSVAVSDRRRLSSTTTSNLFARTLEEHYTLVLHLRMMLMLRWHSATTTTYEQIGVQSKLHVHNTTQATHSFRRSRNTLQYAIPSETEAWKKNRFA